MFRTTTMACSVVALSVSLLGGCSEEAPSTPAEQRAVSGPQRQSRTGEELFRQFCHNCHPDGGNVSDPKRTLHGSSLRKGHVTRAEDIVRIMRRPLSRMISFDQETISDKDARAIAEYVLNTFK